MWAEDNLGPGAPPCLESYREPADSNIYIMYHGTSREAAARIKWEGFRQSSDGMFGPGVYLSRDLQKASRYPLNLPENQRVIVRVKVNVGRVKKIDYQGHPMQKTWHDQGYDTAWCPPNCGMVSSGLEEDCVWDPRRITVIDVIFPNMWAEDDLGPEALPCLESYREPADGQVYRMYHGTSRGAAENIKREGFRQSSDGMFGPGVYLSRDLQKASRYPLHLPENQRVVLRVKVNVGRVKKIDSQGHPMQKTWHNYGYDTAWCPPNCGMVSSGLEEDCVWDPRRITVIGEIFVIFLSLGLNMWAESDLYPGVLCLQSTTEPVNGNVYRMYHGTTERAAQQIKISGFQPSADGMLGRGVYLSRDLNKASRYPLDKPRERVVIRVKVNVGRVKKIDHKRHPLQNTWHDHGYDTAWCPPNCGMVTSGLEEDCVWDPNRITIIDIIPPSLQSRENPVEGKDYTMFYGTSKEEAEKMKAYEGFQQSSGGMLGPGVYLSRDLQKASRYPLHLSEYQRVIAKDTAWCPPNCGMVPSGLEEDCVWDPRRITVIDLISPMQEEQSSCRIL
uniref:Grass carp reovirus (GCRV)-induced gene 2p n=1 Tax=Sinocyclocheilus grahami TaxID=75366 RepID=A0A672LVZ2_SINGR